MNKRIRISACMMVRNEEKNLPRCLASIQGFVDEIVVVDTGSTDGTIEIARAYGAKIYEHPWQNDFSMHRNQSLGYASGDFLLVIDADEELVRSAPSSKIRELLRDLPQEMDCLICDVKDIQKGDVMMQFRSSRIFRKGAVRYEGIVHNRAVTDHGGGLIVNHFHLRHYGYDLTPDEKERKFVRSSTLLLQRLAADPLDYQCHFYLSQLYMDHGQKEEGIHQAELYTKFRDEKEFNDSIWFSLVRANLEVNKPGESARWLKTGIEKIPDDLDLYFGMVELGLMQKDIELVVRGTKTYLRLWDEYQASTAIKERRFLYTAKERSKAWVTGALAITCLEFGTSALKGLENMLPTLEPTYARTMTEMVAGVLKQMTIPINVEFGASKPRLLTTAVR